MDTVVTGARQELPILNNTGDDIPRPRCPFYGLHRSRAATYFSTGGNQCGLSPNYSSCAMEVFDHEVDWDSCSFNIPHSPQRDERFEGMIEHGRVWVNGKNYSMKYWFEKVMGTPPY